jgi:hypothetical protein
MTQAEIMEKARVLERLQQEMQADIDSALVRPSTRRCGGNVCRLAWLELYEQEGWLLAQVDAASHAMGLAYDKRAEALEALLSGEYWQQQLLAPLPIFEDITHKATEVQLHCAASMDWTSVTTRVVPNDRQCADALRALRLEDGLDYNNILVDQVQVYYCRPADNAEVQGHRR